MYSTRQTARGIVPFLCLTGFLIATSALFVRAADKPDLTCGWRDREVVIDGDSTEWTGSFVAIEKPSLVMGMMNDEDYLYVCLIPQSREIRAGMLLMGFTLWFDPAGGKEKVFGVGFPVGSGGRPRMDSTTGERGASEQQRFQAAVEAANSELEILVPRTAERHRIPVKAAGGIEVKLGAVETRFVYEAKIPLVRDENRPYAIGAVAGQVIGVQMETPEFHPDRNSDEHHGDEGGAGGWGDRHRGGEGMEGGPGGPGGGGPTMGEGGKWSPPKPLKLWMRVQLAVRPPSPPTLRSRSTAADSTSAGGWIWTSRSLGSGIDATPLSRAVDVHVASLRQKIEPNRARPQFVITIHRLGYRFDG